MDRKIFSALITLMLSGFIGICAQNQTPKDPKTTPFALEITYGYDNETGDRYIRTIIRNEIDENGRIVKRDIEKSGEPTETYIHSYKGCKETIALYIDGEPFSISEIVYRDSSFLYETIYASPTYLYPVSIRNLFMDNSMYGSEYEYDSLGREKYKYIYSPDSESYYFTTYSPYKSEEIIHTTDKNNQYPESTDTIISIYYDEDCLQLAMQIDPSEMKVFDNIIYNETGNVVSYISNNSKITTFEYKYYEDRREQYMDGQLSSVEYYAK